MLTSRVFSRRSVALRGLPGQRPKRAQKRLLCRVLGSRRIAGDAMADLKHAPCMAIHQRGKGGRIAGGGSVGQCVIDVFHEASDAAAVWSVSFGFSTGRRAVTVEPALRRGAKSSVPPRQQAEAPSHEE
jgi:hypothetical protein